jgi:Tol biopolymer transport system component
MDKPIRSPQTGGRDRWPSFSPDGRQIAFTSSAGSIDGRGNVDIWVVPSSGGRPARLVDWDTPDWGADWSPDGARIAFASTRTQAGEDSQDPSLWILPVDGGEAVFLTAGKEPDWSIDGTEILYKHQGDLWKISADGGKPTLVLDALDGDLGWARFSPDGSRILFNLSEIAGGADIWIADVSGMAALR